MSTWGAYFSSYVKKKEDGTLVSDNKLPEESKSEVPPPPKVNIPVQKPSTATKKLYGATFEEKGPQGAEKAAGNAARVAKLFGRDVSNPALAQVVSDAVKQKKETVTEPKDELILPKSTYVPITQKSPKKASTKKASPKPVLETKDVEVVSRPAFVPITQRLRKDSISETVAMMSSHSMVPAKLEVKQDITIVKPPTTPRAQVTVLPPLQTSPRNDDRQSIPIMFHGIKHASTEIVPLMISDKALVNSPLQMRKTRARKDSKFSEPSVTRNGTQTSFDDLMNELGAHTSTFSSDSRSPSKDRSARAGNRGFQSRSPSSERNPRRDNSRLHSAKSSVDDVLITLQRSPVEAKSPGPTKQAQRRGRSGPKQSISELDDIMLALQAEIKAEPKSRSVSPRPPFTKEVADMQVAIQRAHRSASSTSSRRTQSPSSEGPLTEVPEGEEVVVEIIESRAWEHARKISEFKLQQELMEKERKRMAEEQVKFQQMEARFREEEEQQRLFVEDVRKSQEKEQQEEDERRRSVEEQSRKEIEERERMLVEQARIAEEKQEAQLRQEREKREEEQRIQRDKRIFAAEEKKRIADEQERNKRMWEEERARNAAEVARLIAEEEERERSELEALKLVRRRDTSQGPVSPMHRRSPDLDDISIYSDDLVESEDDFEEQLEEERRAYELEQDETRRRDRQAEEERAERVRKREEQDRREQLRYEAQQTEKLRLAAEAAEAEARRYEFEEKERQRRQEEAERTRIEMQQDDERRRVEEQKQQKLQFQKEQEERRQYALEEATRLREAEQLEERRRIEAEKIKSPAPFQKEQNYWAERKRMAAVRSQPQSPLPPTPRSQPQSPLPPPPRSPLPPAPSPNDQAEERRIQALAAKLQAEDEAAEAEAAKQEELRKAEEKIRAAFAGMARERGEAPPPVVPMKEPSARIVGKGGPLPMLNRAATFQADGPAVPTKEGRVGMMKGPLVKRAGTVAGGEVPVRSAGVKVGDGLAAVAPTRGGTVVGRPGGLPSGPRAGRGLPSGPRAGRMI
ncbi:hypothetical protein GLAREA_06629 [Glarea lozoyensis ATCC 20868]|uniref:Uncharacterized protein n=1 Tax=Glarea lozoyensis (strain ATCC 20868 / MF5171) TaxID=1116229 RepID=S3DNE6_GLAL2|nr:uncharacterized protein GLAREA_06629 [Glarea lozoyensis ATCC 20868]EPE33616.1 hypothetical protein GLAREA_06629 [Glarea lozoyensis ATCC 20868]